MAGTLIAVVTVLTAIGWTTDCHAQVKIPRVGILAIGEAQLQQPFYPSFERGLAQRGWVPRQSVVFEYRFARGEDLSFREGAEDLVRLDVDVIFASSAPATSAAYAATRTVPVVALDYTTDPVAAGYAKSYGRPGRNLTGVFLDAPEFAGKWIELLRAIVPELKRVAVLWDPAPGATHLRAVQNAAKPFGLDLQVHEVRVPRDLDNAFAAFRGRPQALIILPSPMTWMQSTHLATLALKYRVPATSMARAFAEAGGAISYGPDTVDTGQQIAIQVAKIIDGAKPGDLPIERPRKFEFVINIKTIKTLGLRIPDSLLPGIQQVGG